MLITKRMPISIWTNNQTNQKNESSTSMDTLVKNSSRPLMQVKSLFPFKIFPDSISVDRNKVDIVHTLFISSKQVFTILIEDIRTVELSFGILTATITFEVTGYEQNPDPVKHIPRDLAMQMRCLILGLATTRREGLNLDEYDDKTLIDKALAIGRTQENLESFV